MQAQTTLRVISSEREWYRPFLSRYVRNRAFVHIGLFKTSYNEARFRMVSDQAALRLVRTIRVDETV